ncbi:MAG: ankyrin repeat domain-containing protein [Legionellales bacterium]|jgi:ankyrin repeat protein
MLKNNSKITTLNELRQEIKNAKVIDDNFWGEILSYILNLSEAVMGMSARIILNDLRRDDKKNKVDEPAVEKIDQDNVLEYMALLAAANDELDLLKILINKNAVNIKCQDDRGNSIQYFAVVNNRESVIEWLRDKHEFDTNDENTFHLLIKNQNYNFFKKLYPSRESIQSYESEVMIDFFKKINDKNNLRMFEHLWGIAFGEVQNAVLLPLQEKIFFEVCTSGNIDTIKFCINFNQSFKKCKDHEGNTGFMLAIKSGVLATVKELHKPFEPTRGNTNNAGRPPVLQAAEYGGLDILRYLTNEGGYIGGQPLNVVDNDGNTVAHIAAKNGHEDILQWLKAKGENELFKKTNKKLKTPILLAAYHGQTTILNKDFFGDSRSVVEEIFLEGVKNNKMSTIQWCLKVKNNNKNNFLKAMYVRAKDHVIAYDMPEVLNVYNGNINISIANNSHEDDDDVVIIPLPADNSFDSKEYDDADEKIDDAQIFNINKKVDLLTEAINCNKRNVVSWFIANEKNFLNKKNANQNTPLMQAAIAGNLEISDDLIKSGVSLDDEDGDGLNALLIALKLGHFKLFQLLESKNASLLNNKAGNINARTIVHESIRDELESHFISKETKNETRIRDDRESLFNDIEKSEKNVYAKINNKKDLLLVKNSNGDTPLLFAAKCKQYTILKKIEKHFTKEELGLVEETVILELVKNDLVEAVKELVTENKINLLQEENSSGQTVSHIAAKYNSLNILEWLLEEDSISQDKDDNDKTPLLLAIRNNHIKVVEFLFANKQVAISSKEMPSQHEEVLNELLECDSNYILEHLIELNYISNDYKDDDGNNLLLIAAKVGALKIINGRVATGNVYYKNRFGFNFLMVATLNNKQSVIEGAISKKSPLLDCYTENGESLFLLAARFNQLEMVNFFLKNKRCFSQKDLTAHCNHYGQNALHLAKPNEDLAKVLEQNGFKEYPDNFGFTPTKLFEIYNLIKSGEIEELQKLLKYSLGIAIFYTQDNVISDHDLSILVSAIEKLFFFKILVLVGHNITAGGMRMLVDTLQSREQENLTYLNISNNVIAEATIKTALRGSGIQKITANCQREAKDQTQIDKAIEEHDKEQIRKISEEHEKEKTQKDIMKIEENDCKTENLLGHGSFSNVYFGKIKSDGKRIAIKEKLHGGHISNATVDLSFENEISIHKKFNSKFLLNLLYVIAPNNHLALEFMENRSLYDVLHTGRIKPEINIMALKIRICFDIILGLTCLHSKGFMHRDLKSDNIFIDENFKAKIGDFGLATTIVNAAEYPEELNLGRKKRYFAPEIWECGHSKHAAESDIYSYAIIVWELMSLNIPFSNYTDIDEEKIKQAIKENPREPIPRDAPPLIKTIITWAWNVDPAKRPKAAEVAALLQHTLSNSSVPDEYRYTFSPNT